MTIGDKHIIDIVRTNPESGFRLLLTKYKKPIYWHIRRIVVGHDDAQDAAQETFVRVFRNFSSCKSGDKLRGWIFRIATNEALRMLDKRKSTHFWKSSWVSKTLHRPHHPAIPSTSG